VIFVFIDYGYFPHLVVECAIEFIGHHGPSRSGPENQYFFHLQLVLVLEYSNVLRLNKLCNDSTHSWVVIFIRKKGASVTLITGTG
jgi:hypothetical protein